MVSDARLMTADELLAMPEENCRYELRRGKLIRLPFEGREHGLIGFSFVAACALQISAGQLGEGYISGTGFLLSSNPDTVIAPDFAFIRKARVAEIKGIDGYIPIPPDLCLEVISRSERMTRVEKRVHDWLDFGTQIVVVIELKRRQLKLYRSRTDVQTLGGSDVLRIEELFPHWSVNLAEIFRD